MNVPLSPVRIAAAAYIVGLSQRDAAAMDDKGLGRAIGRIDLAWVAR